MTYNLTVTSRSFTLPPATPVQLLALNPNRRLLMLSVCDVNPAAFKFGSAPASAVDGITLGGASASGGQGGSILFSDGDSHTTQTYTPVDAVYAMSALGTSVAIDEGTVYAFE